MESIVPVMSPAPGDRLQRFVGDRIRFTLSLPAGQLPGAGWQARLRTNLGRAEMVRREILQAHARGAGAAGASWRDLPLERTPEGWSLELPLAEAGYFRAKAYLLDPRGWQHWPAGADLGISVHPDRYRTANTIYCAFPRLFGPSRTATTTKNEAQDTALSRLDQQGFSVIPPSGKLRDLTRQLPHIVQKLGCRVLHLLPIHPTPTTYARFGRFGSPYAALDLTDIDPALVVFDKRSTGIDQFRELTFEAHRLGARVILDIVINHTGWGSVLQNTHPEWFLRQNDGTFASPGAWGTTWEDLVELKHVNVELWDALSEMFLSWCRRGVDGFRCDAGYKVPVEAWQYIVARVQQEYPETLFLLEGLGGAWEATEGLLTEGGMQWAYSELFQNYSPEQVSGYLDHSLRQSQRVGLLVHYSETHDNERLAAKGRAWALLRNRLCALASVSGGFGFTCGVEWLAAEKIRVHGNTGMSWDNPDNLVGELGRLDRLLSEHPCFFDGAKLTRVSDLHSPVYALRRQSAEGKDTVLVLINTDAERAQTLTLEKAALGDGSLPALNTWSELLGQPLPKIDGRQTITLPPAGAVCLAPTSTPMGLHGEGYRRARAQAAWALTTLNYVLPAESVGDTPWQKLAAAVDESPEAFLSTLSHLATLPRPGRTLRSSDLKPHNGDLFPRVIVWQGQDTRRITLVPPGYWLLVRDSAPFRATLDCHDGAAARNAESIAVRAGHVLCFAPRGGGAEATLLLERYGQGEAHVRATVRFLEPVACLPELPLRPDRPPLQPSDLVLLTNGRGGMARLAVDLGRVTSKYDCVLGANLHPSLPVDRHVFVKRIRVWVNADGFISPLNFSTLAAFTPGTPASWDFVASAGDGRSVEIQMSATMLAERNTTVFQFSRPTAERATGKQLPEEADVRLTVRLDIEDRNFHCETQHNGGSEFHFSSNTHTLGEPARPGFRFTPAADRQVRAYTDSGEFHAQPEWSNGIAHPVEQSRGQTGGGDAYSPGWFELPLPKGAEARLVVTAEPTDPRASELKAASAGPRAAQAPTLEGRNAAFGRQLRQAVQAFVVRRDSGKTVVAGYPWFLDWGRDSFICARGLVAAGLSEEVKQLIGTFARFEKEGTLPNTIHGEDASNRDTSDAPLWFALVCEETGQTEAMLAVLRSIARHYSQGTPNGIRLDPASALIWSPSHFTWMDTNYPACTPREGYPVEIQALWIRLLRQLAKADSGDKKHWSDLAAQALGSYEKYFWRAELGYYADVLRAGPGQTAAAATVDTALRSNCLFGISLGLVQGEHARRTVAAAGQHLVVPGALRSLAPLPVAVPLPNRAADGHLLNDPAHPYWGRYEGDEDSRRKPAYHNGTAWTWTFPVYCEALARAWDFSPDSVAAARAYLGSLDQLLYRGCLGQIPEITDGDAPHQQRGCDAQAWGATEALRVWKLLEDQG